MRGRDGEERKDRERKQVGEREREKSRRVGEGGEWDGKRQQESEDREKTGGRGAEGERERCWERKRGPTF